VLWGLTLAEWTVYRPNRSVVNHAESGWFRPVAVIPATAGIQRQLNKDTGFRVPLRGPGMTATGRMRVLNPFEPNVRFG